jgi:hypothetical protein
VPKEESTSRLGLLLAYKQINNEASGIAYSKMSMSLETVSSNLEEYQRRGVEVLMEHAQRLRRIVETFTQTFGQNLAFIPVMRLPGTNVLHDLASSNSPLMDMQRSTDFCTAKCASLSHWQGMVHILFHNIRRITLDGEDRDLECLYKSLTKGAFWLCITMQPDNVEDVLSVFSNLEEIVVRRECGEQVNKVADGKIYVAESGM